jgi:hypothetical protein
MEDTTEELSPRQEELVSELIEIVDQYGKFGQGIDSEGSHYTSAENNPFKSAGLICGNCAFYAAESKSCSIVVGEIDSEAICKFWVIANAELNITDVDTESLINNDEEKDGENESYSAAKYANINFSPPAGVRSAAKRGLALHEEGLSGDGLESATVAWARKYVSGDSVSPERARMGNRFYGRNSRFANAPKDSPAWVSWLLWGGASGRAWFARLVKQMNSADKKSSASLKGGLRLAEHSKIDHPFIKEIEVVLTDFEPNANSEGIERSEIDNVIRSSRFTPIKIATSENGFGGHTGAKPVGAIVEAYASTYKDRDVIMGRAFIWKDEYPAVYELLKSRADVNEFIGTSWEVYYTSADEREGVRWLKDITFAGTCIVDHPAYGNRTPLLSVAEEKEQMEELKKQLEDLTEALAQKETELDGLRTQIKTYEEAELRTKAEARKNEVIKQLSSIFSESEIIDKLDFYLSLEEAVLTKIVEDMQKSTPVKSHSETDSRIPVIPEPSSYNAPGTTPKSIADQLKKLLKEDK